MSKIDQDKKATDRALLQIAKAFTRQTYPLSEEGADFKQRVERVLILNDMSWLQKNADNLPTVEQPHLNYFESFEMDEKYRNFAFGVHLRSVQVTKGCIHNCLDFCNLEAEHRISATMPFAAVKLISHEKLLWDRDTFSLYLDWKEIVAKKFNFNIDKDQRRFVANLSNDDFVHLMVQGYNASLKHPLRKRTLLYPLPVDREKCEDWLFEKIREDWEDFFPMNFSSFVHRICNFNDSDPINYRDQNFRHLDGTMADYGDVVEAMSSDIRPIEVSTAGWYSSDHIAQRAVEKTKKIYLKHPSFSMFRLSIKKAAHLARVDYQGYVANIKRMLRALYPVPVYIEIYYDRRAGESEWATELEKEIEKYLVETLGECRAKIVLCLVSHNRTGVSWERAKDDEYNPYDCAYGIHICPDGRMDYVGENLGWQIVHDDCGKGFVRYGAASTTREQIGSLW